MIDHICLPVQDVPKGVAFYAAALAPLGFEKVMEFPHAVGFGVGKKPEFWVVPAAAREAGGEDNGAPGLRPKYHADYYGAFVLDPDGHDIEAVCHGPAS